MDIERMLKSIDLQLREEYLGKPITPSVLQMLENDVNNILRGYETKGYNKDYPIISHFTVSTWMDEVRIEPVFKDEYGWEVPEHFKVYRKGGI